MFKFTYKLYKSYYVGAVAATANNNALLLLLLLLAPAAILELELRSGPGGVSRFLRLRTRDKATDINQTKGCSCLLAFGARRH